MPSKVLYVDAGHGGRIPKTGKYTTAPSKMFIHQEGIFHDNNIFYEGVKNRTYCNLLIKRLTQEGITAIPVYHEYKDTSLANRVALANYYHNHIQEGIYLSEHSNATRSHKARGFQVWTSPGKTRSDAYASKFLQMYENKFLTDEQYKANGVKVLKDLRDGDPDYEAKFYVLTKTNMPAILFENLFFDNFKDANLLMWNKYMVDYVELQVEFCKEITK